MVHKRVGMSLAGILLSGSGLSTVWAADFYLGGYIKQGASAALNPGDNQSVALGPTQFTLDAVASYKTGPWSFDGDIWFRGDWFYDLEKGNVTSGGIQDFTKGPPFTTQFRYSLSRSGTNNLPQPFGASRSSVTSLSQFDRDMLRNLSVTYKDPNGVFQIALGKFQRGWGQADGLRLLDVLYAQDLRTRSIFTDAEDLRIPAWSAEVNFNLTNAGVDAPFKALGLHNTTLQFIAIPQVRHDEFVINNATPGDQTNGGLVGFPFPRLIDGGTGWGLPFIGANLNTRDYKNFDRAAFGLRLKFDTLGGEATLNGFRGYQELPIVKLTGSSLLIGNALNNPAGAAAVVPLDLPTTIGAIQAPGGYISFLNALKSGTAAPGQFPLLPFGCNDVLVAAPSCSVNANFDLDYRYQRQVVGGSFTRDMSELQLGPKGVSPVLRAEFTYEFNKPFNVGVLTTQFGNTVTGSTALIGTPQQEVQYRNQISMLLGVDYNLWLPFWQSQQNSIFLTSQFFDIHTHNANNLLFQAPYAFNFVHADQKYFSQTWSMPILNQSVTLDGLFLSDISNHGVAYRQRIDFTTFGGRFKPRIEYGYFNAPVERGLFAVFRNSQYLELSATYQF